jgi:hypothetical protein
LTAPTLPRISSGVRKLHQRKTDYHADRIGSAQQRQRKHRQPHPLRQREYHRGSAEHDHGLKHPQPDMAIDAVAGQHDGHQQRADRGRRRAGCRGRAAGFQNVARIDRQQRHDAAEQHSEQVERDGAEDRRVVADEADAGKYIVRERIRFASSCLSVWMKPVRPRRRARRRR